MSKKFWIGCDIAKNTFWIALAEVGDPDTDWTKLPHREFEHTAQGVDAFIEWLADKGIGKQEVAGICLEATGRYSLQWNMLLEGRLSGVSIVNPARPKDFRKSLGIQSKSDRIDACVCAMFGRTKTPPVTTFRSPVHQELCDLFRLYLALDSGRLGHVQRLNDDPSTKAVRGILRKTIKALERQIANTEAEMDKIIEQDQQLRQDAERAQSITGVGKKSVRAILAEFGDLRQYKRNKVVALAGLFPLEFTSGTSVHKKPRLAKGSGGRVRRVLYMCAMSARKYNPHLKKFADRLENYGKAPMQVLCAIMRKLLLMVRAVIVSGHSYDPAYGT